jgi:hypothetical protein
VKDDNVVQKIFCYNIQWPRINTFDILSNQIQHDNCFYPIQEDQIQSSKVIQYFY